MKWFIIFVFQLLCLGLLCQDIINPRLLNRHGIILSGGGPGLYGSLSYDYFISSNVDVEVGAGPLTVFGGIKYHIDGHKNKNWTPYLGCYGMYIWIFELFSDDDDDGPIAVYIPVGVQYIGKKRFSFAVEVAGMQGFGEFIEFGAVKFGYRF